MIVQQGLNFYMEFNRRIDDLQTAVTDYILARDYEKNDLIKSIQNNTNFTMAFDNPSKF